ncbi:MAG: hypothetical protein PHZ25_01670 [Candidatus Pacebacteria bacterium]|jgi:hypothetical protein|nr:hypothetical protein [Candidatus Paceibacterota bacterium]
MSNPQDEYVYMPMPSQSGGVPVPNRQDRADFVDKIKPEQVVELIRHKLLGEEEIGGNWVKVPSLQKNALSDRGAWEVSNLMLGVGSISVSISKLNSTQINNRLRGLMRELMVKMLSNWREYHLVDVGQFYYVKSLVFSNALVVLSQAGEGSIQELFKTTIQENRNISTEKKEPGKLRRILGMGG